MNERHSIMKFRNTGFKQRFENLQRRRKDHIQRTGSQNGVAVLIPVQMLEDSGKVFKILKEMIST